MNHAHLDVSQVALVVLAVLAGLGVIAAFRSGARSGHRLACQTQETTRLGGNLARALATTTVIVGIQWVVLATASDPARARPVRGSAIARMFAVTEIIHGPGAPERSDGHRPDLPAVVTQLVTHQVRGRSASVRIGP